MIETHKVLESGNAPLPQDRQYPVIYADPPWQFEFDMG